ncbi:MAG: agmatinase [Lentisphaeria bacterium]|nr:agmatinase [Lentisphaeria bacterium]
MNRAPRERTMVAFLQSELTPAPARGAGFHVIPVPLERTVSYGGGARRGPEAILAASQQLELFDGTCTPALGGIHTAAAVPVTGDDEAVQEAIATAVAAALDCGAVPVLLGGEHSVSYGAVAAVARRRGGDVGVVQFDAHADLRDTYGGSPWSHACVMRRVVEAGVPLFQLGVRSLSAAEAEVRSRRRIGHLDARLLAEGIPEGPLLPGDFPRNLYLTLDVDVLDCSLMPATGTPEPGGLHWWMLLRLLERVLQGRRIVGFDVVELAPCEGLHHCDYTAAKLVYVLMALCVRQGPAGGNPAVAQARTA